MPRHQARKKTPERVSRTKAAEGSTALVPTSSVAIAPRFAKNLEHAAELAAQARSESTRKAYETDIRAWKVYANETGLSVFPISSGALAAFIAHMDEDLGLKLSTIRRRCTALAQWHRERGELPPNEDVKVREEMKGLARKLGIATKKKRALSAAMVREMLEQVDSVSSRGLRDRTILLTGLATGMRRSELAAMNWEDVLDDPDGLVILIPKSKADQEGRGQLVALPYIEDGDLCPARTLLEWRELRNDENSVFGISAKTIYRIVKRYTKAAGFDPTEFGAHSLRSGFATEAGREGATLIEIMAQTRHKSREVAQSYVQQTEIMQNRAVKGVLRRLQDPAHE